jgi:hypothetical protein
MTVPRVLAFLFVSIWLAVGPRWAMARPCQDPKQDQQEPKPENLFSGTVVEFSSEKVTVSRKVLGKTEKRTFRVTADTKCDGQLKAKVRVTIRFVTMDDGEAAEAIFVRPVQKK